MTRPPVLTRRDPRPRAHIVNVASFDSHFHAVLTAFIYIVHNSTETLLANIWSYECVSAYHISCVRIDYNSLVTDANLYKIIHSVNEIVIFYTYIGHI